MVDVGIFMAILSFYGHMVNVMVIWYIFPRFGMLNREKSGNPVLHWFSHRVSMGLFDLHLFASSSGSICLL
jgi:hypothetical protein